MLFDFYYDFTINPCFFLKLQLKLLMEPWGSLLFPLLSSLIVTLNCSLDNPPLSHRLCVPSWWRFCDCYRKYLSSFLEPLVITIMKIQELDLIIIPHLDCDVPNQPSAQRICYCSEFHSPNLRTQCLYYTF